VNEPTQLNSVAEQMAPLIELLYCTNDNTVNKGAFALSKTCNELNVPFVIGELSAVEKGALFGIGVEYSAMGSRLADMASEILQNPGRLPSPEGPPKPELWLNKSVADSLKISFPEDLIKLASKIK
jgi:putative ABC transport system substrate-binding protein